MWWSVKCFFYRRIQILISYTVKWYLSLEIYLQFIINNNIINVIIQKKKLIITYIPVYIYKILLFNYLFIII